MAFINALAWLVLCCCVMMGTLRTLAMSELSYYEMEEQGRRYALSIVRYFLAGVVAVLWLIFG